MPIFDLDVPRVESAAIEVDGVADEAAWAQALVLPPFIAFSPTPDAEPTGQTTVRIMADDRALWLHFTADDPEPQKIRAGLGRRDTRLSDDYVGIYLDPTGDVQRSYLFAANVLGVQTDGTNAAGAPEDPSWDARWFAAGRRTDAGYEVEIGIPWRAIRHPKNAEKLGIWAFRSIPRAGERSSWPRLSPDVSGLLVQEAIVGGPGELARTLGLDVIPELTFGWTDQGAPTGRLTVGGVGPAAMVRYSPSARFQALGTINPDFSQVESDTSLIDVNQRFALYYEERRPFFLEGQEAFTHPFDGLIYTRSMSTPLYGVRATSEVGGWTGAVLNVLDRAPRPTVSEGGGWSEADLEGAVSEDTIVRVRKSIGPDSFAGILLSDKEILGTGLYNRMGGVDARVRISDRLSMDGSALMSSTEATGVGGSLAPAGNLGISYGSKHVGSWLSMNYIDKDFRAENGFITYADRLTAITGLNLEAFPKLELLPSIGATPIEAQVHVSEDGELRFYALEPQVYCTFGNGVGLWASYARSGDLFADELLETDRVLFDMDGAWTEWFRLNLGGATGTGALYDPVAPAVGWKSNVWTALTLQPLPGLSSTLTLDYERFELDGGVVYAGFVGREKLEMYASRRLWARLVADRSEFNGRTRGEALLAYEYWPGSAFYAGGARQWYDADVDTPNTWQVFAKGSWVFSR